MPMNKRDWRFALLWINSASLIATAMMAAFGAARSVQELLFSLLYSLIFANVVGCIGAITLTRVAERMKQRRVPLTPVMICAFIAVVVVGGLAAQLLLVRLGMAPGATLWRDYLRTLRVSLPLTLVFGMGAMSHGMLRDRIQTMEIELRERAIGEERQRKLAAEARLQLLESRLHPHFLFNTLNAISALIAIDPGRAEAAVGRLATLLRSSLDNSSRTLISLREELRLVESYLELEHERFGDRLRVTIEAPEELLDAQTPPMSVQTLAENAVKHGVTEQIGGGEVRIQVRAVDDGLRVRVSDSGPGFELTQIPAGHGLDNLVGRLDLLFGDAAGLSVFSREGLCVVEMSLPR